MSALADELGLSVRAKPLQEHLTCPICFEVIRESRVVSACGHHFCKTCITESIGRSHRCPCCNVAVPSADSLRPDHQFDAICATFVEETAKSEQSYFARLIAGADAAPAAAAAAAADGLGGGAGSAGSADPGPALTAIEQVFRQRLGQSLADHQAYLQQLAQRHAAARARLEASANNPADIAAQLRQLDDQHAHSVSLLAQAYDALLQTALPKSSLMPIRVDLTVPERGYTAGGVVLRPGMTGADLKTELSERMRADGIDVLSISNDAAFDLHDPFDVPTGHRIDDSTVPQLEVGQLAPGSRFVLRGTVLTAADVPKTCFASTFVKGAGESVNYYSCKDCGFNWICQACRECCHRDHHVTGYIMNHTPTWACCYCPKKKTCTLGDSAAATAAAAAAAGGDGGAAAAPCSNETATAVAAARRVMERKLAAAAAAALAPPPPPPPTVHFLRTTHSTVNPSAPPAPPVV